MSVSGCHYVLQNCRLIACGGLVNTINFGKLVTTE